MKNFQKLFFAGIALFLTFAMGAFVANAAGVPQHSNLFAVGLGALSLIPKTTSIVAFDTVSPDLSAISKYAVTHSKMLLKRFFNILDIANDITLQPNVKNKMPLPMLVINGQPRPYSGNHKPSASDISYTDRELEVELFQRDISIDPSFYKDTYLASLRGSGEGANNQNIPFAQFTMEAVIDYNSSILNNQTAFYGLGKSAFAAYSAAATYAVGDAVKFTVDNEVHYYTCKVATTAGDSPTSAAAKWALADALAITEGIGTKIKAARVAGKITNVVTTGALTSSNAYLKAIEVYRKLPEEVRNQAKNICLYASSDVVDLILDSYETDVRKFTKADDGSLILPRTGGNCKIVRASWMNGSKMVIATPKSNLYMGTDLLSDTNDLRLVPGVYKIDGGLKALIGFQFADEQAIAINDQN